MAPYSDDIQSPDWQRDYPSNGGDAIAYQTKGHLYDLAAKAGITLKNYGEYVEENTFTVPDARPTTAVQPLPLLTYSYDSCEPTWSQFYEDTLDYESGTEPETIYYNTIGSYSPLPNVMNYTVRTTLSSIWASPTSTASMSGSRTSPRT